MDTLHTPLVLWGNPNWLLHPCKGYVRLSNWCRICWVCTITQLVGAYAGYVKVSRFLDSNMSSSNFNIVLLCFALLCSALLWQVWKLDSLFCSWWTVFSPTFAAILLLREGMWRPKQKVHKHAHVFFFSSRYFCAYIIKYFFSDKICCCMKNFFGGVNYNNLCYFFGIFFFHFFMEKNWEFPLYIMLDRCPFPRWNCCPCSLVYPPKPSPPLPPPSVLNFNISSASKGVSGHSGEGGHSGSPASE